MASLPRPGAGSGPGGSTFIRIRIRRRQLAIAALAAFSRSLVVTRIGTANKRWSLHKHACRPKPALFDTTPPGSSLIRYAINTRSGILPRYMTSYNTNTPSSPNIASALPDVCFLFPPIPPIYLSPTPPPFPSSSPRSNPIFLSPSTSHNAPTEEMSVTVAVGRD